jgi:adenosine 3'-phospho 5'-phosphosulfate transporter B2
MAEPSNPQPKLASALWCAFYGAGIIGSLVIYGLLQERIMSVPYDGEYFTVSVFLVFCNRIVAIVFALCMIAIKQEDLANAAPFWKYLAISFSSVAASTCQYEALKYVSFPVQMLGKSFKMMPVMLWGMAISGKQYSLQDWLVAAAVTGGVTEFLLTGNISSKHHSGNSSYGLFLLVAFLGLDGFTSTFQEKLFKEHKTSKFNQMLYVNLGSAMVSSGSMIASGSLTSALSFCVLHPAVVRDATYLSASAVGGQWFILSQVKEFGALVFAATMNVRQVVSILLSYATFGHKINLLQTGGLMMVFGALFYKSYAGLASSTKEETTKQETHPLIGGETRPLTNSAKAVAGP